MVRRDAPTGRKAVWLVIAGLVTACARGEEPTTAVRQLLEAIEQGRTDAVWDGITAEDRSVLLERQASVARLRGAPPDERPAAVLGELRLRVPSAPEHVVLASRPGDEVRVRVTAVSGRSATFTASRGPDGRWRVALLEALQSERASSAQVAVVSDAAPVLPLPPPEQRPVAVALPDPPPEPKPRDRPRSSPALDAAPPETRARAVAPAHRAPTPPEARADVPTTTEATSTVTEGDPMSPAPPEGPRSVHAARSSSTAASIAAPGSPEGPLHSEERNDSEPTDSMRTDSEPTDSEPTDSEPTDSEPTEAASVGPAEPEPDARFGAPADRPPASVEPPAPPREASPSAQASGGAEPSESGEEPTDGEAEPPRSGAEPPQSEAEPTESAPAPPQPGPETSSTADGPA